MITTLKNSDIGITQLGEITSGCWINVIDPSPEEVSRLIELGIPQDYLTYPLDEDERARTERDNGALFIVLRIPYYQGRTADIPYITIPLGIIMTDKFIVTVCKRENEILQEFASGRVKSLSVVKRNRFLLRLFLTSANKYLHYLREITKEVDILEDKLQLSTRNREVLELLKHQKSLTYFTTALKSNELMMERLQRSGLFKTYPDDEDLLEDVLTENQQAIEMTNIASNILSSMMDAFASIISNNLNGIMKFLASITILVSIPTLITSVYGMNVDLPFQAYPWAFPMTLAMVILVTVPVVFIFRKLDWF
jgi:magnesium transporter